MRVLLLAFTVIVAAALAATPPKTLLEVDVSSARQREKVGRDNIPEIRRDDDFVDRVRLRVTHRVPYGDPVSAKAEWFIVGRQRQNGVLVMKGRGQFDFTAERTPATLSVESEPMASNEYVRHDGSARIITGTVPHGWAVIISDHRGELLVRSSNASVLKWVREQQAKRKG